MKRVLTVLLVVCLAVSLFAAGTKEKTPTRAMNAEGGLHYTLRIGAGDEAYRAENLQKAADMLNKQLKAEGVKDTVSVEYILVNDFTTSLQLWQHEQNFPEFIAQTGGMIADFHRIGALADASYVVNGDVYTKLVPKNLRDMGIVDGTYAGIVLDTECRFVIVYKPALTALGWSEKQIEDWKLAARAGKVTARDLQLLAKEIVDKGITPYGITHRPNKGADWRFTFVTWNRGVVPVNEKGQAVINRTNIIEFLSYWRECVRMGITPYNHLTDYNWDMLEGDIWPNGKSFCYYGQIASKADMMSKSNASSEYIDENFFTIPNPVSHAGDPPVSGSNPYFYALTNASQVDEKTAEYARRILENVLDPELQLNTSLYETHLAITEETIARPEYQADKWMVDTAYLTTLMFSLPANESMLRYTNSQEMFDAIQEAEVKALDPSARSVEAIADDLIAKITFNIGAGNYVIVD